jgi:formate/nitrite transporter FocA (FNT family)
MRHCVPTYGVNLMVCMLLAFAHSVKAIVQTPMEILEQHASNFAKSVLGKCHAGSVGNMLGGFWLQLS